jgi:hypothetical protein
MVGMHDDVAEGQDALLVQVCRGRGLGRDGGTMVLDSKARSTHATPKAKSCSTVNPICNLEFLCHVQI